MTEEEHVAAELGLTGDLERSEIRRIWHAFAMRNHPDRLPSELRDRATRRMIIANVLVDRALRAVNPN